MITFNILIGFMINVDRRQKVKCEKHDNTTDVCKKPFPTACCIFCYLLSGFFFDSCHFTPGEHIKYVGIFSS